MAGVRGSESLAGQFDRKRFEELVLYIAEQTSDDPRFGRTKLAKTLFYADVEAFRLTGDAITNAEYQNWEHGPFPPRLQAAERLLKNSGLVEIQGGAEDFDEQHLTVTGRRRADLAGLGVSAEQIAIIDQWIATVSRESARQVERTAHDHPGYRSTQRNERIAYASSFLPTQPPTPEQLEEARELAREQGWLVGDEWKW
jgi:hypothetical protein